MEHVWVRDYDVVDHSCAYCKVCKIWYADYCHNGYPECTEQITRNNPFITITDDKMQEFVQRYEPTISTEYKYLFMDE